MVLSLLAAACASDTVDDGYEVADRVLESLGQPTGEPAAAGNNCVTVEREDEYGFVSEVTTCDREPVVEAIAAEDLENPAEQENQEEAEEAAVLDADQLLNSVGDLPLWVLPALVAQSNAGLQPGLNAMVNTLGELEQACGNDFFGWRGALMELSKQATEIVAQIEAGAAANYVGTTESRALTRALMERSFLETGCQNPGAGQPSTEADLSADGTLELTAQAAQDISELGKKLGDMSSGYLFHFFTTADNYEWLRTQTENIDLIVYGTSQAGAGIDVPVLARQMATNAGNAFLYGSLAEVQQHWFPEVERYANASTVVWLVGSLDLLIDCEPRGREQQFTDRVTRRQRTFATSGWFANLDPVDILLGPAGPPNENKGNGIKKTEPDPAALAAHVADYTDRFAAATFCENRAKTIASAADRMAQDGRRVVIVGMPLNPIAYEQLPGGVPAAADALAKLSAEVGANADFIDLTNALQDRVEVWADYTHLTEGGATEFTELLAAELKQLGL